MADTVRLLDKVLSTESITKAAERLAAAESASPAPVEPASFEPVSSPHTTRMAMRVARQWQDVPDNVSDTEALERGFITPELLMLIMTIFQDLFQNCLSNRQGPAWRRVRNYAQSKEMDRLGDSVRLRWLCDRWINRMGLPRDRGDVVELSTALAGLASSATEEDFKALQTEILFLTI